MRWTKRDDPLRSWPLYDSDCGRYEIRGHGRGKSKWWLYDATGRAAKALGMGPRLKDAKTAAARHAKETQ